MDRKILIKLLFLFFILNSCNVFNCKPFTIENIAGTYLCENFNDIDIDEKFILKKDSTFEYQYISEKRIIIHIYGAFKLIKDGNGLVEFEKINIDNLDSLNFINPEDFNKYKKNKASVFTRYYFDDGSFNKFDNPNKLIWGCNYFIRNPDTAYFIKVD